MKQEKNKQEGQIKCADCQLMKLRLNYIKEEANQTILTLVCQHCGLMQHVVLAGSVINLKPQPQQLKQDNKKPYIS